jgi:hypothetical protein
MKKIAAVTMAIAMICIIVWRYPGIVIAKSKTIDPDLEGIDTHHVGKRRGHQPP